MIYCILSYQYNSNITIMYVWGRNNNNLIKQNYKKTYSLPQKVPMKSSISRCASGHDYIFFIKESPGVLFCYYQSAIYKFDKFKKIVDIATTDNMIVMIGEDSKAWIMEFNPQKIVSGQINPTKVNLNQEVDKVIMSFGDIFLITKKNAIYHLKRNQWYETKTYTDPVQITGFKDQVIIQVASGLNFNYFLSKNGQIFSSRKNDPYKILKHDLKVKFLAIAASQYFMGISTNGRLYVWGTYINQFFQQPTQFGKLAQRFVKLSLGAQNGYGITQSGECWVWGKNSNGELGLSDYQPRYSPYPLITLEKQYIKEIYLGQNYAVGLIDVSKSHNKQKLNNNKQDYNIFQQEKISFQFKKTKDDKQSIQKQFIKEFTTVQIDSKHFRNKDQSISKKALRPLELLDLNCKKQNKKRTELTPQKSISRNSQHSKSPALSAKSQSKSPLSQSKSPYLQHNRQKSLSNRYASKQNINKIIPSKQEKSQKDQVESLQKENQHLRKLLKNKEQIIEDITAKIRLLEDAIQQHERSLTNRDTQMQQYYRKQKQYIIQIDELQKTIDALIKGKMDTFSAEDVVNDRYLRLKNQLQKEKEMFNERLYEYQRTLQRERNAYKQTIDGLQKQIDSYRCNSDTFNINTMVNKKKSSNVKKQLSSSVEKQSNVEFIISRIEDSKVRIGKSANKLIKLLGQSD